MPGVNINRSVKYFFLVTNDGRSCQPQVFSPFYRIKFVLDLLLFFRPQNNQLQQHWQQVATTQQADRKWTQEDRKRPLQALQQSFHNYVPRVSSYNSVLTNNSFRTLNENEENITDISKEDKKVKNNQRNHICPYQGIHNI